MIRETLAHHTEDAGAHAWHWDYSPSADRDSTLQVTDMSAYTDSSGERLKSRWSTVDSFRSNLQSRNRTAESHTHSITYMPDNPGMANDRGTMQDMQQEGRPGTGWVCTPDVHIDDRHADQLVQLAEVLLLLPLRRQQQLQHVHCAPTTPSITPCV